jgi:hypothetical protein
MVDPAPIARDGSSFDVERSPIAHDRAPFMGRSAPMRAEWHPAGGLTSIRPR